MLNFYQKNHRKQILNLITKTHRIYLHLLGMILNVSEVITANFSYDFKVKTGQFISLVFL